MATAIKLSDVVVKRDLEPEPFPDDVSNKVMTLPIILRRDMVLIDGLRRLRQAEKLGWETIPALVSSDYPTLVAALRKQNGDAGNEVSPRRLAEIYDQVLALGITWSRNRFNGGWDKLPNGKRVRRPRAEQPTGDGGVRQQFIEAFSYSPSMFGHIHHLYRLANGGHELAVKLAEQVDAGEISPQRAVYVLSRPYNLSGNVTGLKEQSQLLERGSANLAAQVDALTKLGFPIVVPISDLRTHYDAIYNARTKITELLNGIRKVIKEAEVQNG